MKSIKSKITFFVAALLLILIAILIFVNLFIAENYFITQKKKTISKLYTSLTQSYSDDSDTLRAFFESAEEANNIKVEIFDENNRLIYTSGRRLNEEFIPFDFDKKFNSQESDVHIPDKDLQNGEFKIADFSENPIVEMFNPKDNGKGGSLFLKGIINTDNGQRFIIIESPLTAISDSVAILNQLMIFVFIVVAIIGCIVAYIFAIRFSRPIKEVELVAQNVAALDFSVKANENASAAEISGLAKSINTMSVKLEGFIHDLMEKNELLNEDNERLSKIEEMRREFIANISHELKSPLALLCGYAEMLKNNTEGLDKDYCYDIIIEETEKMNQMIKSMLDVASLEHGLKEIVRTETDFSNLVFQIVEKQSVLIKNKNIKMDTSIEEGCYVKGDSFYLENAIKNYIQNAVSHTRENGQIYIKLSSENNKAVFSVYNEGEQISEDKKNKIWDSFYKTNEARTRDEGNNIGLGLYIVKTIISSHEGDFGVMNKENGVEFWFSLDKIEKI